MSKRYRLGCRFKCESLRHNHSHNHELNYVKSISIVEACHLVKQVDVDFDIYNGIVSMSTAISLTGVATHHDCLTGPDNRAIPIIFQFGSTPVNCYFS